MSDLHSSRISLNIRFSFQTTVFVFALADTSANRQASREELRREMVDLFINGDDGAWVNYAEIDEDENLDDLTQLGMDEEESYFDED